MGVSQLLSMEVESAIQWTNKSPKLRFDNI
jgi:hypothetical protein